MTQIATYGVQSSTKSSAEDGSLFGRCKEPDCKSVASYGVRGKLYRDHKCWRCIHHRPKAEPDPLAGLRVNSSVLKRHVLAYRPRLEGPTPHRIRAGIPILFDTADKWALKLDCHREMMEELGLA